MVILEKVTKEEIAEALRKELEEREKKKEAVQRWGERISMMGSLAPTSGYKINMI